MYQKNEREREDYFLEQEEALLKGGAAFSEWCTFISKSVYDAFVSGADLATVITAVACIEAYFRTESMYTGKMNLATLIDKVSFLSEEEKSQLHELRRYRNRWVHLHELDDSDILKDEDKYLKEAEQMSFLAVKLLLTVLFSCPFI